jgi:hypothetical protein
MPKFPHWWTDVKWQSILEDWAKAFVAGSVAVLISTDYNVENALKAGLAAMLPLIYAWANTKDTRYGRK